MHGRGEAPPGQGRGHAGFLLTKLGPLLAGYGVAVLLSWAMPDYAAVREVAWITLVGAAVGNLLRNLAAWGVPLPTTVT